MGMGKTMIPTCFLWNSIENYWKHVHQSLLRPVLLCVWSHMAFQLVDLLHCGGLQGVSAESCALRLDSENRFPKNWWLSLAIILFPTKIASSWYEYWAPLRNIKNSQGLRLTHLRKKLGEICDLKTRKRTHGVHKGHKAIVAWWYFSQVAPCLPALPSLRNSFTSYRSEWPIQTIWIIERILMVGQLFPSMLTRHRSKCKTRPHKTFGIFTFQPCSTLQFWTLDEATPIRFCGSNIFKHI